MLNDLPPLPPIRKPSNGKNYEVNNDIFTVPGQMTEESEFLASIDTVQTVYVVLNVKIKRHEQIIVNC